MIEILAYKLAHVYHYYLHPENYPDFSAVASNGREKVGFSALPTAKQREHGPVSIELVERKRGRHIGTYNLADITDLESRYYTAILPHRATIPTIPPSHHSTIPPSLPPPPFLLLSQVSLPQRP